MEGFQEQDHTMAVEYNAPSIHQVLQHGAKQEVVQALQQKIDPTGVAENGDTLVHAILKNDKLIKADVLEIVTYLLNQGVNANVKNNVDQSALHLAIKKRMNEAIDLLLQFQADINAVDARGNSVAHFFVEDEFEKCNAALLNPLMYMQENRVVMEKRSVSFLEFLMTKGVNFGLKNKEGKDALLLAIERNLPYVLPTLLNNSVAFSTDNTYGRTIISNSIMNEREASIVRGLIDYYLKKYNDKGTATALFHELLGTCKFWVGSDSDYFISVLRHLLDQGVTVTDESSRKKYVFAAIDANNLALLTFLKENVGLNFKLKNGHNLLHYLAENAGYEASNSDFLSNFCSFLISIGCAVNSADLCDKTALHIAASRGNVTMIQTLIDLGANVNCVDEYLRTPLHGALLAKGSVEVIGLLLSSKADVNAKDHEGRTPLHLAAANDNLSVIELLINCEAAVNSKDANEQTPLHRAVLNNVSAEIVDLLLVKGSAANATDSRGQSLLAVAVSHKNLPMVQSLIKHGALANHKDKQEQTPLYRAMGIEKAEQMIDLLVKSGADVNVRDIKNNSPLDFAICNKNISAVEALIKHGVDVHCADENQHTPLHRAVIKAEAAQGAGTSMAIGFNANSAVNDKVTHIVELLMTNGADLNAKGSTGETPLHLAVARSNLVYARALVKHGASVNCTNNSLQTPLHIAAVMDETTKMVEFLLKSGANADVKDDRCNTPLHQVFARDRLNDKNQRILKMLLKNGADVNARNNEGDSALFLALTAENTTLIDEILKYSVDVNDPKVREFVCQAQDQLQQALLHHLVKLKAANLPLAEDYKVCFDHHHFHIQLFLNECLKEIEQLKNFAVDNAQSLYDFLHMSAQCRAAYVNHEEFQQFIKSPRLDGQFPIYSNLIAASYQDAATKKPLLKAAQENSLEPMNLTKLPEKAVNQILDNLTEVENDMVGV